MKISFSNLKIRGIASALPHQELSFSSLEYLSENEIKRIVMSTGIRAVRVAEGGVNASDLCQAAALKLLDVLAVDPGTIDAVLFVSQTPDYIAPATSALLQDRLKITQQAVAFDINYGCSGYIYGLYQAAMLLQAGGCQRVLLCAGDVITPLLHEKEYQVRMVLGDAGTATLIEKNESDDVSPWAMVLKTDGSGAEHLRAARTLPGIMPVTAPLLDGYYHMNGAKVMEFALREVPPIIEEVLALHGWKKEEVGIYAFHQANEFMLNYLRKKCKLLVDAVPIAMQRIGNTGPASIPVLLSCKGLEFQKTGRLNKVVCCGFGVGLSWAAVALSLADTHFCAPVEI